MEVLHDLKRKEGIGKEEDFMWREKERKTRKAGVDSKQFSRKYGSRVPETVVGGDVIDREYVACFES